MFRLIDSGKQAIKRPRVKYFLGTVGIIIAMSVIAAVPLEGAPPAQSGRKAVQASPAAHKTIATGEVKSAATEQSRPSPQSIYSSTAYRPPAARTAVQQINQPAPQQPVQPVPVDNTPQPVQSPPKIICRPMAEAAPDNLCTPRCGAGRMCPYCSGTAQDYSCVLIYQSDNATSI